MEHVLLHTTHKEIKMSNPYQLRYQILDLARQHLMEEYYSKLDIYKLEQNSALPTYPSVDLIFKTASEFKGFVETP